MKRRSFLKTSHKTAIIFLGVLIVGALIVGFSSPNLAVAAKEEGKEVYTFVLVHGSWHDGRAWDGVRKHLEAAGHKTYAPTLAGHGPDADRNVTMKDVTGSLVDFIVKNNLKNMVLVGHSFAGFPVSLAAEQIPDRIRRLVYFSAFIPRDGYSMMDDIAPGNRQLFRDLAKQSKDNTIPASYGFWREMLINDADSSTAKKYFKCLSLEPLQPLEDKIELKTFNTLTIPKSYLLATDDMAIAQGTEYWWHPRHSSRLGFYRFLSTPGSHELMFSNPERLAQMIVAAGRD